MAGNSAPSSKASKSTNTTRLVWVLMVVGILSLLISYGGWLIGSEIISVWLSLIILASFIYLFFDKKDVLSIQNLMPFVGMIVFIRLVFLIVSQPVIWYGYENFPVENPISVINKTIIVTIMALTSYYGGYHLSKNPINAARLLPKPKLLIRGQALSILIFFMFFIGIGSQALLISRLGGIQNVVSNIGVAKNTTGIGILVLASNLAMNAILVSYFRVRSFRGFQYLLLVGGVLLAILFWTGRRANVLPLILFAGFAYHYKLKKIKLRSWVILALIGYLLLVLMVLLRVYIQYEGYRSAILTDPLEFYLGRSGGDLVIVDAMLSIVGHENSIGIRPWSLYHWYGIFPYLIPRFLFPGKPFYESLTVLINSNYVNPYVTNGMPATAIGTLFLNAGYFGVIVGSSIMGYIARTMKQYRLLYPNNNIALLVYTTILYVILQFMRTGDFTAVLTQALSQFGALVLIFLSSLLVRSLQDFKLLHFQNKE